MNAFDRALFRRALFAIAVLFALTAATVIATDEATSTLATRTARLSALSPLVIAAALLGVGAHARARGELRAIEALGTAPWRSLRGAEYAGMFVAVLSMLFLVAPFTDVTSLMPAVSPLIDWVISPDGSRAVASGLVVHASGVIDVTRTTALREAAHPATWAAAACVGPIAGLVPSWAATPMASALRVAAGSSTALMAVVALHLVAASRVSPSFTALASLPLALSLWRSRR